MKKFFRYLLTGLGISSVVGLLSLGLAHRQIKNLKVHEVTAPILKAGTLPTGKQSVDILHISDLHMLESQDWKQAWVADLAKLNPDLIINTGDNLGEQQGVDGVLAALAPHSATPGAFVFGSNDYYAPRPVNPFAYLLKKKRPVSEISLPWQPMRQEFLNRGWKDATHQEHTIDLSGEVSDVSIYIAGVDDPHHNLNDFSTIAGGAPASSATLKLGLSHSPEPAVLDQFSADSFDIVLSGHTHGGQICLPGQRALLTNCGIEPEKASGLHTWTENMWIHVTNGLGNSKYFPFRTFCPPSATVVHITEKLN